MKITDVSLTLFAWDDIPPTTYGQHTARLAGKSALGLLRIGTDEGIEGHAFLGSASNPASLDGPGLITLPEAGADGPGPARSRGDSTADSGASARAAAVRAIGAVDVALWDIVGKAMGQPIHRLLGTYRDSGAGLCQLGRAAPRRGLCRGGAALSSDTAGPPTRSIRRRAGSDDIKVCEAVRKAVGDDYTIMLDSTWTYDYPGGAARRPRDRGDGLLLVRGSAARPGHLQLREAEAEARHPDPRHRVSDRRARFLPAVDHASRPPTSCAATSR